MQVLGASFKCIDIFTSCAPLLKLSLPFEDAQASYDAVLVRSSHVG